MLGFLNSPSDWLNSRGIGFGWEEVSDQNRPGGVFSPIFWACYMNRPETQAEGYLCSCNDEVARLGREDTDRNSIGDAPRSDGDVVEADRIDLIAISLMLCYRPS